MEGVYLAIGTVAIYTIFGPLVLLALYVLFDKFIEREPDEFSASSRDKREKEDPGLWTEQDVKKFLKKKKHERVFKKV